MALPARDHRIASEDAAALTRRYREAHPTGAVLGGAFHTMQVLELLEQPNCVALRIYLGLEKDGVTLVLVGVDDTDRDMVEGIILEQPWRCPPYCARSGPLTS